MPQKPKTYETENAVFYEVPRDHTAEIISAAFGAATNAIKTLEERKEKQLSMKKLFVQLNAEQQKQLLATMSEKDKKFYALGEAREETAVEKAQRKIAEGEAERQPVLTKQLQQAVDRGDIELKRATQLQNIIDDPKADLWDKAFAQGLRGQDAEKFVLNKKYPELADELLQVENKVGPKFEQRLVGEYFSMLNERMGKVDPKYTLKTAQALAASVGRGDPEPLNELNKDPNFPKAMRTLAYERFKLDADQLQESRASRLSSERSAKSSLMARLMEQFPGEVGPTTAAGTVEALWAGKPVPGWAQEKYDKALALTKQTREAMVAKESADLATKISGVPEVRQAIDTLRQLQQQKINADEADPVLDKQIESLKKDLLNRMTRLYGVDMSEAEAEKSGFWNSLFTGASNILQAGVAAPGAGLHLAGDAIAGAQPKTDALMDALVADGSKMPRLGSLDPSLQVTAPLSQAPINPNTRLDVLKASAERLLTEFSNPQTTPERKQSIRRLLQAIRDDPDGANLK